MCHESDVNKHIRHLSQCSMLSRELRNSIPNGLLNAVLAETVTTGCLNGIPQSHEADRALIFTLEGWVKLHVIALEGGSSLETSGGAANEGARAL